MCCSFISLITNSQFQCSNVSLTSILVISFDQYNISIFDDIELFMML